MNKKFSTFMTAGLLLSGALVCNVNAAGKKVTFVPDSIGANYVYPGLSAGDTLFFDKANDLSTGKKFFIVTTPGVTLLGDTTKALTGRVVIAAENVKVEKVKFITKSVQEDANGYWTKTALTAFADKLIVDSCSFTSASPAAGTIPNGIVLYPQTSNVTYGFKGNVFNALNSVVESWYSSAIQIYKKAKVESDKTGDPIAKLIADKKITTVPSFYLKGSGNPVIDGTAIVDTLANKFLGCTANLVVRNGNELDKNYNVEFANVTTKAPALVRSTMDADIVALVDAIKNSTEKTVINVTGVTASQLASLLSGSKIDATTAEALTDKNLLINTSAKVGGEEVNEMLVVGTVADVPENTLIVKFDKDARGFYVANIAEAGVSGGYLLMTKDGKALVEATSGTVSAVAYDAKNRAAVWTVTIKDGKASFKNSISGKTLKDEAGKEVSVDADDLNPSDVVLSADKKVAGLDANTSVALGIYVAPLRELEAGKLITILGKTFSVKVGSDLKNNPFVGSLKPVMWVSEDFRNGDVTEAKYGATSFMLQDEEGKLLVMQTTNMYATSVGNKYAYRLAAIDPLVLATSLKKGETTYASDFSMNAVFDYKIGSGAPISNITVKSALASVATVYKLGSIKLSNENTLAASKVTEIFLDEVTVTLAAFDKINPVALMNGKFYTVTNKNTAAKYSYDFGKVLGIVQKKADAYANVSYMNPSEVLVGYPETQWAVTVGTYGGVDCLIFANRENPNAIIGYPISDIYKTKVSNVYAINGDTLEIKAVPTHKVTDGYKRLDADKLRDQVYYLGSYSGVRDTVYASENHKDNHLVGLDKLENATEWRMAPLMKMDTTIWGEPVEGTLKPETAYVISKLGVMNGTNYSTKNDTLKINLYSFQNLENDEYMAYSYDGGGYRTGNERQTAGYDQSSANYFALKIMGGDSTKYNLVAMPLRSWWSAFGSYYHKGTDNDVTMQMNNMSKVYAGETSSKGILNNYGMFMRNESDLFTLAEKAAPEYLKLEMGDVIKLYRSEYNSESNVLYEKSGFLGMGNAVETPSINPAMYVDTAYVDRGSNNRWQYLLGLNISHIDTTYQCSDSSHGIHKADTIKGRFLVNLVDSAIMESDKADIHVKKFVYDNGTSYAKLAFVNGFHTNDTLTIHDGAKIALGSPADNVAKFAFRIMDPATEEFVVEVGDKFYELNGYGNPVSNRGYLRYINGNVVVTPNIEDAEIFNLKDDNRQPVNNEDMNASSVKVLTVRGQVIISGAQGKKVMISNVLGQVIANAEITSDNVTFAVPAGYVTVCVDGEQPVKAIVK